MNGGGALGSFSSFFILLVCYAHGFSCSIL